MIARLIAAAMLMMAAIVAAPASAEWRRAESPNFILFGEMSERALRERILLLEQFDRLLRTVTNVNEPPAPNRLAIYIVRGPRELQAIRPVGRGVGGFYTATTEGVAAFVDSAPRAEENLTLFHEYAHHFMMQYRPNAYPAWYVEGFAEYFMTARFAPEGVEIGNFAPGRAFAVANLAWLPMKQILEGQRGGLSLAGMNQFYAQSWLLVHFFYSTPERQALLGRLLRAARSAEPGVALASATGWAPDQLGAQLEEYIRGGRIRYRRLAPQPAQAPSVSVTVLPRGANDLMIEAAALRIGVAENGRPAALARIRAAAARHSGDPFATRVLAQAEALFGDPGAADRLLDSLLAASPNDAELLYWKGRRFLNVASGDNPPADAARAARDWFGRAHRADPNHFQTLYRFAESLRGARAGASENTSNVLLLAHRLAPQVHDITMESARVLLARGERAEAARLLAPLAADPHDSSLAQAARELLAQANAAGAPTPGAATDRPGQPPAR